jgi:HD-GYP domain-containing protein (c-di-GMP phosphodiesterase class II)
LCGLFHDIGKVEIPREVLNKAGRLSDQELAVMRSHPLKSVQQILKLRASQDMKAQIILPPFEHHLRYDLSGYPRINWKNPISFFGRIVTIADVFDAITSPRVYRPTALSQDKALGYMLKGSGTDFDPLLLKVFINMMGVYPVGTLLELDTGELGLVLETPEDAEDYRPIVTLLERDEHGQFVKGENFNLNTRNGKTGKFLKNISSTHHPSTYGIQPAAFIL